MIIKFNTMFTKKMFHFPSSTLNFPYIQYSSVPFSNYMNISEHEFDRLDEIFAQRPISQLIMMMVWNRIEVLKFKIPKKLKHNIVPNFVPFSVFEDEISRTEMAYDTIEVLEVWFRSEEAHSRKLNKTRSCNF